MTPAMPYTHASPAIESVNEERKRQDGKWGEQNHEPVYWLGILGEEFGELCLAVNETVFDNGPENRRKGGYENMRSEAVQVAAVAVAFVEMLDRRAAAFVPGAEERTCQLCGCTDSHACEDGCYWVTDDLCSACAELFG